MEKSCDLLHNNLSCVSREFISKLDECSIDGKVISSSDKFDNLYYYGFARDLLSICLTGDRGLLFAADTVLIVEDFAKHGSIHNFSEMKEMEEEDLTARTEEEIFESVLEELKLSGDIQLDVEKMLSLYKKEK